MKTRGHTAEISKFEVILLYLAPPLSQSVKSRDYYYSYYSRVLL